MFRIIQCVFLCGLLHGLQTVGCGCDGAFFKLFTSAMTPDNATRISASSSLTFASEHFRLSMWLRHWRQTQPTWLTIVVNAVNTSSGSPVHVWWYTCLHTSHLILLEVTVTVSLQNTQSSSSSDWLLLLSVTNFTFLPTSAPLLVETVLLLVAGCIFLIAGGCAAVVALVRMSGKRVASQVGHSIRSPRLSLTDRLFTFCGQRPSSGKPSHFGIISTVLVQERCCR